MRRRVAIVGLLVVLAALAGCSAVFGPGEPDSDALSQNSTYDWESNATASILVNESSYKAVYDVSNQSHLEVYRRDELGQEHHVELEALRYQYPNGTVVSYNETDALDVRQTRERTNVSLPNESAGKVAFTAPRNGKRFTTPVYIDGSYEVTMPPDARIGVPLLSQANPRNYDTTVEGDRMTVRWPEVTSRDLSVRWYLERDLVLFSALAVGAIVVGSGGAVYYYRQIRRARRRREEYALDVNEDDDPRDRGPPPGMR